MVLLWRRIDTLCVSCFMDDVIFAHKLRLLEVAARLRQRGAHAALGLARRNTRCRQRTLGTASCSQGLLGCRKLPRWQHRGQSLRSMTALFQEDSTVVFGGVLVFHIAISLSLLFVPSGSVLIKCLCGICRLFNAVELMYISYIVMK